MNAAIVAQSPSYRVLLRCRGFPALTGATACGRLAEFGTQTAILLFVLQRFHSPPLVALAMICRLVPGLVLSPLAGALLDRVQPARLISVDLGMASGVLMSLVLLDLGGVLTPWWLLVAVTAGSCTSPLSLAGARSLVTKFVPRELWGRANAVDSGTYVVATMAGPAAVGLLFSAAGGHVALTAIAAVYAAGALMALRGPRIPAAPRARALMADVRGGVTYLLRHRALRNLAVVTALFNVANGLYEIAVPIAVLDRHHDRTMWVGLYFAIMGAGGVLAGSVSGRWDIAGRERLMLSLSTATTAVGLVLFALCVGPVQEGLGMLIVGLAGGVFDVALLSLRQRVTDTAILGRVIAVSTAANMAGTPIGSALAPSLLGVKGNQGTRGSIALIAAAAIALAAAVLQTLLSTSARVRPPEIEPNGLRREDPRP